MSKELEREQLIKLLSEEDDEYITLVEFCKKNKIGAARIYDNFNSFSELKKIVGKKSKVRVYEKKLSDEELLDRIRDLYKEKNRIPFYTEVKGAQTIAERFGTFNIAIEKALNIKLEEPVTDKECVDRYNSLKRELKKVPSKEEFFKDSRIILPDLKRLFGGWLLFKRKLKDEFSTSRVSKKISDKEVIKEYLRVSKLVGKPYGATKDDFNKHSKYSTTILKRFGGMNDLRILCNLEIVGRKSKIYKIEDIEESLILAYNEKGRRLTVEEVEADKLLPSSSTLFAHYKTTNLAEIWKIIESKNVKSNEYTVRLARINGEGRNVRYYENYVIFKNERYDFEKILSDKEKKNEKDKIYIKDKMYKKIKE